MEDVSLVNMNIAGTPTARPTTPKKTTRTTCKKIVVKPDGLGISRQKLEEVDEPTHALRCPLELRRSLTRVALLFLVHSTLSKYGGKGSCSETYGMAAMAVSLASVLYGECSATWSWNSILSFSVRQLSNRSLSRMALCRNIIM